ncbi:hypothetical protein [Actinomadura rudentiformis]|uniref:Uncharacterized protein n=1 Tax=Actinomadura rudentiformis TaxID=359158 RepID=A0A6H9Z225_9ACTN|nr:hypothetical protein [Actinomadura rudentiformis]KAB2347317.1 hypothetical protein F8566_20105 [Actinomadura rudentiformis]
MTTRRFTAGDKVRVTLDGTVTRYGDDEKLTVQYPSDLGSCETDFELGGTQVKAQTIPPSEELARDQEQARQQIIRAALRLAATEWGNGRESAGASMDLDFAHDQFDEALARYVDLADAWAGTSSTAVTCSDCGGDLIKHGDSDVWSHLSSPEPDHLPTPAKYAGGR